MGNISLETSTSAQYLTFRSAGVDYALPILRIREIIPYVKSTRMPLAPETIRGLINLRGHAIPVLDLAIRFGAERTDDTKRTCVLIIDLDREGEQLAMGLLADSVARVVDVAPGDFEDTPSFGMGVSSEFLSGMLKLDGEFIPILDIDAVLRPDDSLHALSREAAAALLSEAREHEPSGPPDESAADDAEYPA